MSAVANHGHLGAEKHVNQTVVQWQKDGQKYQPGLSRKQANQWC